MNAISSITECLISSRNILFAGHSNEHVLPCLKTVLANIESVSVSGTRQIIKYCVSEAIEQIERSDFISAGKIINLIHNLPLEEGRYSRWDIDYFLSIELASFLDEYDEITSSRKIVLYVCSQLAGLARSPRSSESA